MLKTKKILALMGGFQLMFTPPLHADVITLDNGDDPGVAVSPKKLGCLETNVAEPLDNEPFSFESQGKSGSLDILFVREEFMYTYLHTAPCRLFPACNPPLAASPVRRDPDPAPARRSQRHCPQSLTRY